MNQISSSINSAYIAASSLAYSAYRCTLDEKVQSVALRILAGSFTLAAVALTAASFSAFVTAPEALAVSAALTLVAGGLLLGAQYLERLPDPEGDTAPTSPVDEDGYYSANEDHPEEWICSQNSRGLFQIPRGLESKSDIFGRGNFIDALNQMNNPRTSYCFYRDDLDSRVVYLLYRKSGGGYATDRDVVARAFEGMDPASLSAEDNLQTFKAKLDKMALEASNPKKNRCAVS